VLTGAIDKVGVQSDTRHPYANGWIITAAENSPESDSWRVEAYAVCAVVAP
jgi:hypothetical protein